MRGWSDQLSGGRANEYGGRAFVRGVLKGLRDYIHQQLLRVAVDRQYASREGKRDMSQLWDGHAFEMPKPRPSFQRLAQQQSILMPSGFQAGDHDTRPAITAKLEHWANMVAEIRSEHVPVLRKGATLDVETTIQRVPRNNFRGNGSGCRTERGILLTVSRLRWPFFSSKKSLSWI